MPKPPDIDDLDKVNFITNYFLQGCEPPFWLFIDMAQAPAQDLLCLLMLPDLEDIVQEIFSPKGGRQTHPGRHGRKSLRGTGFPDTSNIIGAKARGFINPYDAINMAPTRAAFKILDKYEGVAFSAAILEGVTDVGYEGLLGVLSVNPEHCPNMGFFWRRAPDPLDVLALIQPWNPMNTLERVQSQHFTTSEGHRAIDHGFGYTANLTCLAHNFNWPEVPGVQIALMTIDGEIRGESSIVELDLHQTMRLTCSGEFGPNEACTWVARCDFGSWLALEWEVLGYKGQWG